jgi:hypothetical protein
MKDDNLTFEDTIHQLIKDGWKRFTGLFHAGNRDTEQQPDTLPKPSKNKNATAGLVSGIICSILFLHFWVQVLFFPEVYAEVELGMYFGWDAVSIPGCGTVAITHLLGLPVSIAGFILSRKGLKSERRKQAVTGIVLNILFFLWFCLPM